MRRFGQIPVGQASACARPQPCFGGAETPRRLKPAPQRSERGFALLVVFLLAAGIMISLYLEMPRVAFESQRNREEMLVERGEQYSRAIEVYYRKNKRYPAKLEDLENTNNLRFLRRRYKDPLTGKDEWRIVHMGAGGQLADSLVEKPGQAGKQLAGAGQPGGGGGGPTNGDPNAPPDPEGQNAAAGRLSRDQMALNRQGGILGGNGRGAIVDPNNPNGFQQPQPPQLDANGNPIYDQNQNQNGFNPGFNPNGQPGQQNASNQPGQFQQQQQQGPNFPGQQPGFNGPPGINPGGVQFQGQVVNYQSAQGFSPGAQLQGQLALQNGQNPAQAGFGQNPALNAINNQLRNQNGFPQPNAGYGQSGYGATQIPPGAVRLPDGTYKLQDGTMLNPDGTVKYQDPNQVRPPGSPGLGGGLPRQQTTTGLNNQGLGQQNNAFNNQSGFNNQGAPGSQTAFGSQLPTSQSGGGQSFGGAGIAGVASTQSGVGIKRYNDRSKYKEWEFIFDYRKPKSKPAAAGSNGLRQSDLNQSNVFKQ